MNGTISNGGIGFAITKHRMKLVGTIISYLDKKI